MKKVLYTMFIIFLMIFSIGCYKYEEEEKLAIDQEQILVVEVGEQIPLTNVTYDYSDKTIIRYFGGIFANEPGEIIVNSSEGKYYIIVKEEETILSVSAKQLLSVGDTTRIQSLITPVNNDQTVIYEVSDDSVLSINNKGVVTALNCGVCRVNIISNKYNISKELTFFVLEDDEEYYEPLINMIVSENENSVNGYNGLLEGIINYNKSSLVGVSTYYSYNNSIFDKDFGSGIIYKMNINYSDGSKKENVTTITNENNIKEFEYFVITNRHLLTNKNHIKIYIGEGYDEIEATLLEYDDKIDLAVVKFTSKYYFSPAKLGDSDEIEKGDFIISIGNGTGKEYFRTTTFGIVSSTKRHVATDTDNDGVNDWDSEYIQHDASINECDSGGAIMNLKGEIIGINSTKISSVTYNNMSFAIPINLVMEIVSQLEQGIHPQRATLGVSILDLTGYWQNPDAYQKYNLQIPEDLKYGFYVSDINHGGVAEKANIQVGDIIVGFNDTEIKYSYQIRAELGKYLIGSGEIAIIKVIRNGIEISLPVEF